MSVMAAKPQPLATTDPALYRKLIFAKSHSKKYLYDH